MASPVTVVATMASLVVVAAVVSYVTVTNQYQ